VTRIEVDLARSLDALYEDLRVQRAAAAKRSG
jgi:hypothetical protein